MQFHVKRPVDIEQLKNLNTHHKISLKQKNQQLGLLKISSVPSLQIII